MISTALEVALAHHRAWTAKDLDTAMSYIDDEVVLDAPAGRILGAAAYRAFLAPFAEQLLIRAELLSAFGDEDTALIMYDTETFPAPSAPAAEFVRVRDGKVVYNRFIFDRLPFNQPQPTER